MIDTIVKQLSTSLGNELMNKFKLNNQQTTQAVQTIGNTVTETLQQELLKGNLSQLTTLLGNKNLSVNQLSENPLVKTLITTAVASLSAKVGLSAAVAQPIAAIVVPKVIEMINNQANSQNASDIIKSLASDSIAKNIAGGLGDTLKKGLGGFFKS